MDGRNVAIKKIIFRKRLLGSLLIKTITNPIYHNYLDSDKKAVQTTKTSNGSFKINT